MVNDNANAIRALAMDAVQRARSGHPGAPMGLAEVGEALWRDVMTHNPDNPFWVDRDRFVLSNGHASMLLYSLLHLTGYRVSIDDLKSFRQLHAKTAGHPEFGECPGVETTTGPLGQGFANAVGMALAERMLAEEFNRDGHQIVDHHTWVLVGDGCLMEGISHEAASLAGTLGLGKLVCVYDANDISIDGPVDGWFTEDVAARFRAYGWDVSEAVDGHDAEAVSAALSQARANTAAPSLVICRTVIGFGSPNKAGTADTHGAPLGDEEIALTRRNLNWGHEPFEIPEHIYQQWDCRDKGRAAEAAWQKAFGDYAAAYPELAEELTRRMRGDLPDEWHAGLRQLARDAQAEAKPLATRKSSQRCLGALAAALPELFGGSADLTGSNGTRWQGADDARHMSYGVREFAMTAITNGIALHGGIRPYSGTFLVFMEYARNAVRLAALMKLPNVFVYTHDSVAVGEDGPTHQPIEQLANLRATPGLSTWRPCDTVECAVAWESAIARSDGPTTLVLTRQDLPVQPRTDEQFDAIQRGGYVLVPEEGELDLILIGTGSEVEVCRQAAKRLTDDGRGVRVVSMPSVDVFLAQPAEYIESVLPAAVRKRVAVEAGHPDGWYRFVGLDGAVVGIDRFGLSAPGAQVMQALGMTPERVIESALALQ